MASKSARRFNPKLISLAVASCFAAGSAYGQAVLPTGEHAMVGITSVLRNGSTMDVTSSLNRSLIQWNTFSIGQGATVNFNQPSSLSAILNRVTGGVPSEILGAMNSNGRVFLINTNGITFGPSAQLNLAGLVASTLNLSNEDFLANRLRFTDGLGAGSVINQGNISAAPGGEVYLVGKGVTNSGVITTPKGEVVLAAGNSIELVSPGTPNLRVEVTAPDNQAVNMGSIVADAGRVGIYAGLVTQGGTIRADSAQMTDDGRIVLKATKNVTLAAGSVTSASGVKGGTIEIQSGDTTRVLGDVSATGSEGKGGTVHVLGNLVGVMGNATIDASGAAGGGTVLVGGDFQGKNPAIRNAYRTFFGPDATIKADATVNGDGGKVIVWSDDATGAYGTISARGGSQGGDGGFVEVSGKRWLDFHAKVDTRAPKGKTGTLLLDPNDVEIVSCAGGEGCPGVGGGFLGGAETPWIWTADGPGTSQVSWGDSETDGTIIGNLQNNNVFVTTSGPGTQNGDITFLSGATYSSSHFLTFVADRDITANGVSIVNNGNGDISMFAGRTIGIGTDCVVCAPSPSTISTGGSIVLSAGGNINIVGSTLSAGRVNSGQDAFLTVTAANSVSISSSSLSATGSQNFSGMGFDGILFISGNSVGISNSSIRGNGGNGNTGGGHGQVSVNSFGNLTASDTSIRANGGTASGPEGSSGGLATLFLNAAGALTLHDDTFVAAHGGRSFSGPGGGAQVSLFGGSVSIGTDACCGDIVFAQGGQGSTSWQGGGAAINIFGGRVVFDGAEGTAWGGSGGLRGGDATLTVASGSELVMRRLSRFDARAGNGSTSGNASVGIAALNDIFVLDSHIEAEGATNFNAVGGSAVVLMSSTLGGITIDGSGSTFPSTVLAESLRGTTEVTMKVFDIINVNHDHVEASSFFGGPASVNLHFSGRNSGGWFVNGVETPNPPGFFASSPVSQSGPQGFFVNGEPAQTGVNFFVTYTGALPDPCQLSPEICSPPRTDPPPITEAQSSPGESKDKKKDEPVCRG